MEIENGKKFSLKGLSTNKLSKYMIVFLAGILLLFLSLPNLFSKDSKEKTTNSQNIGGTNNLLPVEDPSQDYATNLEKKLKSVLGKVEGIGEVDVMITLKSSKELVTLKDSPYTQESMNEVDGEGGSRISSSVSKEDTTVIVNGTSGNNVPYVIKEIEPEVSGVVVIAKGGENILVKAEITEAVQVLFNVPAHKIKVMTMNK